MDSLLACGEVVAQFHVRKPYKQVNKADAVYCVPLTVAVAVICEVIGMPITVGAGCVQVAVFPARLTQEAKS